MAETDLLYSTFLSEGKKEGLSEILLKEIFEELQRTQYVPAGERETIRARIKKIIEKGV